MSEDYDRLSPLGEEQARKLGSFWVRQGVTFHNVYCGPARRHIRTMEIAGEELARAGRPWPNPVALPSMDEFDAYQMMKTMVPLLIEKDEKIRQLNQTFNDNQQSPEAGRFLQYLFEAVASRWCMGEWDTPGLETWAQFQTRVQHAIQNIRSTAAKSTHTVVFTSGGPIAASVAYVLGLDPAKAIEFVWLSRNASYSQFLFSGPRMSLSSFNSFPHLDEPALLTYR